MLGTDYGVTASVWCTTEAARLLRPVYAGSAVLGLLSVLYVVALLLGGRRPAPTSATNPVNASSPG